MIGFLITGHADFSKGLLSSLNMIAGEQEKVEAINFVENENLDNYQEILKETIESLQVNTEGVVVFTDLLGGTPFRTSMLIAAELENVEVITGSNLPMILEGTALRFTDDVKSLAKQLIDNGKNGIENPHLDTDDTEEHEVFEGGI